MIWALIGAVAGFAASDALNAAGLHWLSWLVAGLLALTGVVITAVRLRKRC